MSKSEEMIQPCPTCGELFCEIGCMEVRQFGNKEQVEAERDNLQEMGDPDVGPSEYHFGTNDDWIDQLIDEQNG